MLTKLLKRETCAACRLCCSFDESDTWEVPVLTMTECNTIRQELPDADILCHGAEFRFRVPKLTGEELFTCPMLTEKGCRLGEQKPFDCRIWPFRLMHPEHNSKAVVITLSELCESMAAYDTETLRFFLTENGLAEQLFTYAKEHPDHVHRWHEGYRLILAE